MVVTESAARVETLQTVLSGRLAGSALPDGVREVILAALKGQSELRSVLDAEPAQDREPSSEVPAGANTGPAGLCLSSVTVEGFRGIGNPATLKLTPGPGLTLVAGRNGSGKSSFAESVELALTGENKRWAPPRTAIWRDAWRNLHHRASTRIVVELTVDGEAGPTRVVREWADGDALAAGTSFGQPAGKPRRPLADMGWSRALELYRPFLSYAELGALVDGKPSEMYDALARILGLDELADAEKLLADTRKELESTLKAATAALPQLQALLGERNEPRAERIRTEIQRRTPDLAVLREIVGQGAAGDDGRAAQAARAVLGLGVPDRQTVRAAIAAVGAARAAVRDLAGGSAQDARRLAGLLATALEHQAQHPNGPCPVCAGRSLDDAWAEATRAEVGRLRELAASAEAAHRESDAVLGRLRSLIGPVPAVLTAQIQAVDPAARAWQSWSKLIDQQDVDDLLERAPAIHEQLLRELGALQTSAEDRLRRQSAAWEPVLIALGSWLDLAHRAARAKPLSAQVKAAIDWLKGAGAEIRAARLAPFAQTSAMVWAQLRQESNVELGPIHLSGTSTSTQRKVALDVTIDGVAGAALAVMSQGELHALGLALFLPRAAAEASPFRFLVIDDPVQSMDPAKVEGLARVLAEVARTRQVVVFSHDDRLAEAVRRLQLPATIWEVVRGEGSSVQILKNDDPVARYLAEARAVARTGELSVAARALVVVGMCRGALEVACHQRIRSTMISAGVRHGEIERSIDEARTLHQVMTLALLGEMGRGSELVPKLAASYGGPVAVRAFKVTKTGVHEPYQGDLITLVTDVRDLAVRIRG